MFMGMEHIILIHGAGLRILFYPVGMPHDIENTDGQQTDKQDAP